MTCKQKVCKEPKRVIRTKLYKEFQFQSPPTQTITTPQTTILK